MNFFNSIQILKKYKNNDVCKSYYYKNCVGKIFTKVQSLIYLLIL